MIQITAYLRTPDDLSKWKAIKNKTQWLHEALQLDIRPTQGYRGISKVAVGELDKNKKAVGMFRPETIMKTIRPSKDEVFCKHGYPTNGWSCKHGCTK